MPRGLAQIYFLISHFVQFFFNIAWKQIEQRLLLIASIRKLINIKALIKKDPWQRFLNTFVKLFPSVPRYTTLVYKNNLSAFIWFPSDMC